MSEGSSSSNPLPTLKYGDIQSAKKENHNGVKAQILKTNKQTKSSNSAQCTAAIIIIIIFGFLALFMSHFTSYTAGCLR